MELVPIKCRMGLRPPDAEGKVHADHPPFGQLQIIIDSGMNWSYWVDANGGGWQYDKFSGHRESDKFNTDFAADYEHRNDEVGCQYGCLLVPAEFAEQAVAMFGGPPYNIVIISEASFEDFYNERAHKHEPEIHKDEDAIRAIKDLVVLEADTNLGMAPPTEREKQNRRDAMNPDIQTERGLRKNLKRYYVDYQKTTGHTIRAAEAKV